MRRLWLVRHATPLVAPGVCYGRLDMEADTAHTEQAAQALHRLLPQGCPVLASPLRRCRQLADAIGRLRPAQRITVEPRLREMDFGDWEGRLWADLGKEQIDAWTADFAHHAPGGGEAVADFMARVAEVVDTTAGGDTIWVTHAGVIHAARLLAAGKRQIVSAAEWPRETTVFGSYLQLNLLE